MTVGRTVVRSLTDLRPRLGVILPVAVAGVLLAYVPYLVNPFYVRVLTEALILGLLAMSINILVGYTGLATLGQAGLFGVAAYTVGYLTVRELQPLAVIVPAALVATLVASLIFGAIAARSSGIYFLMITLAQGMIVWGLAFRWYQVTGAENGISGIVRPDAIAPYWIYYYVVLAITAIIAALYLRLVTSPFGLTLKGIREGERRMGALGYHVWLHKFLGFAVAGLLAGVAGVLYAFLNNFVSPTSVEFATSAEALLMVILGGTGTLFGPLVGSFIIVFTRHQVSLYTDRWLMILGAIFVVTILIAPDGLVSGFRRLRTFVAGSLGVGRPPAQGSAGTDAGGDEGSSTEPRTASLVSGNEKDVRKEEVR